MIARGIATLLPQMEPCLLLCDWRNQISLEVQEIQWRGWLSPACLRFEAGRGLIARGFTTLLPQVERCLLLCDWRNQILGR